MATVVNNIPGTVVDWTVPTGVTEFTAEMWGGAGGNSYRPSARSEIGATFGVGYITKTPANMSNLAPRGKAGDLFTIPVVCRDSGVPCVVTAPAGWNLVASPRVLDSDGTYYQMQMFWRIYDGTNPSQSWSSNKTGTSSSSTNYTNGVTGRAFRTPGGADTTMVITAIGSGREAGASATFDFDVSPVPSTGRFRLFAETLALGASVTSNWLGNGPLGGGSIVKDGVGVSTLGCSATTRAVVGVTFGIAADYTDPTMGGKGGYLKVQVTGVTAGQVYKLGASEAGSDGTDVSASDSFNPTVPGGKGSAETISKKMSGANGEQGGGGGGGASSIRRSSPNITAASAAAGGGGGGGAPNGWSGRTNVGGDGGGATGVPAQPLTTVGGTTARGGGGSTSSTGGTLGVGIGGGYPNGGTGQTTAGHGGFGGRSSYGSSLWRGGGGGGGGWAGGGGGGGGDYGGANHDSEGGGGGGACNYAAPALTILKDTQGVNAGGGKVVITFGPRAGVIYSHPGGHRVTVGVPA